MTKGSELTRVPAIAVTKVPFGTLTAVAWQARYALKRVCLLKASVSGLAT